MTMCLNFGLSTRYEHRKRFTWHILMLHFVNGQDEFRSQKGKCPDK